jgi:16S rRNA processing protein RimM
VALPVGERVTVGLVRGLHGLRGAVRVEVLSDDPDRFTPGSVLFAEGDDRPLTVAWTGPARPGLLVRFDEFDSRESVEPLRDTYLEAVPESALPPGTWYWHQIRGLEVTTTSGEALGRVVDVFRAGENEVYVVEGGARGELMIPAVRGVVVELDPPVGRLIIDPVALDLPDGPPRRRRRHELDREARRARRRSRPSTGSATGEASQGSGSATREASQGSGSSTGEVSPE